jgi:hypothetical protein
MKSVTLPAGRRAIILAIPALFFVIYVASASRTIVLDDTDAAEFQLVGVMGGTLHQPYPLWSILARVFAAVPFGEPAFRVTLLSIAMACAALAVLIIIMLRITGSSLGAGAAATAFGLSYTFWRFASTAEVYALQTLLFLLLLAVLLRPTPDDGGRRIFLTALLTGTLITQHTAGLALLPVVVLFLAWESRKHSVRPRVWVGAAVCFVLPALFCLLCSTSTRGPSIEVPLP